MSKPTESTTAVVVDLRSRRPDESIATGKLDRSVMAGGPNDPIVAEALRLFRSFAAIEDDEVRASIVRLVERKAKQSPLFRSVPLK